MLSLNPRQQSGPVLEKGRAEAWYWTSSGSQRTGKPEGESIGNRGIVDF